MYEIGNRRKSSISFVLLAIEFTLTYMYANTHFYNHENCTSVTPGRHHV